MKKILFLVAFFSLASFASVSAQTEVTPDTKKLTAAMEAAKSDPSIIQKVGSNGQISFKQKSVCSESGRVSFKPVQFDVESQTWGAVASTVKSGKAACGSKSAKSCGDKPGKSCCSSKAKSCGSKASKS